ncbi:MAG: hypothetical protein IPK53_10805 [bacterium]|nr:hypothetical protein [bacterium]
MEEVTDWGAQEIFYDIVSTEQGLTDTAFPVLLDETVVSKQRLLDKRDELLLAFPPLNEANNKPIYSTCKNDVQSPHFWFHP